MLVKDCTDKQVNLLSDLSTTEFYTATKSVYDKYSDHPFPTIGEDNWESFAYLITKGTYAGSLIKRLAKWMKKEKGFTPDPKFIGEIGNAIGKTQSKNMESYLVSISNYFDWVPGTFNRNQSGGSSETDSCFWKSRNCAREALRDIYDAKSVIIKDSNENPLARCWLISASNTDFMRYDGRGSAEHDIIFNAYGNLELYKIARILTYCGYSSYNKINFYSTDGIRLYINSDTGFALSVSGEECTDYLRINPSYDYSECDRCDYTSLHSIDECPNCASFYKVCDECGCRVWENDGTRVTDDLFLCGNCFRDTYAFCYNCNDMHLKEDMREYNGYHYCSSCQARIFVKCEDCGELAPTNEMWKINNGKVCTYCKRENYHRCEFCRSIVPNSEETIVKRLEVRVIDFYTNSNYIQMQVVKEKMCKDCMETKLIKIAEDIYIYPRNLTLIKNELESGRYPFVYRDEHNNFTFGFDFKISDLGIVTEDGVEVYSIMEKLIDRFISLSSEDHSDTAFNRVIGYDEYFTSIYEQQMKIKELGLE